MAAEPHIAREIVETAKWLVPLGISIVALIKSFGDTSWNRSDSSSRARQTYNSELRSWAGRCIETIDCGISLLKRQKFETDEFAQTLNEVCSLADQGRLFFPNVNAQEYGLYNPRLFVDFGRE